MIIYLSDKKNYRKSHSYDKKMSYTVTMFNRDYKDYKRLCEHPKLKDKFVIWYSK